MEWRRSWNVSSGASPTNSLDLLALQPGETLDAVWWSYEMHSLGNAGTTTAPPLAESLTLMGLILQPESEAVAEPFPSMNGPWLWLEQAGFDHVSYAPNQGAWLNYATTGRSQRKAKGRRIADPSELSWLRVSWQTYQGPIAGADETSFYVTCAVSAAVLLPGP